MIPRTAWYEHDYEVEDAFGNVTISHVIRRPSQQLARMEPIREAAVRPAERRVGDGTPTEWAEALFDLHTAGQHHADVRAHYLVTGTGDVVEGRDLGVTCGPEDLLVIVVEPTDKGGYTDDAKAAVRQLVGDVAARVASPVFFPAGQAWDLEAAALEAPEPAAEPVYSKLSKAELKRALEDADLPTSGTVAELRDRLAAFDKQEDQA